MDKKEVQELIITQGLLPLYYHNDPGTSIQVLHALYKAGVRVVEYTNRGEHALDNFMAMRKVVNKELPGMQLGVGTVKTRTDAEIFIAAGADFIVSPIINPAVAELAHKAKLLWIPGCMTATELHFAETCGAVLVKIFPGNILGPSFAQAVKEIFPKLLFMPTGGVEVDKDNLQAWFNSGVSAVGMGSKLITKPILEKNEFDLLTATTIYALQLIKECRK